VGRSATALNVRVTAALLPEADICLPCNICRDGPIADIATFSLDHFVGKREHCGRHGQSNDFGGLEVDDQIEFGRLHDGVDRLVFRP
jgi:hypothetical protein